jgi:hypothetical protein
MYSPDRPNKTHTYTISWSTPVLYDVEQDVDRRRADMETLNRFRSALAMQEEGNIGEIEMTVQDDQWGS